MLHCGALTVRKWYATKLLMPSHESMVGPKRRWWYRREDVDAFAERYVSAKEAATLVGCSELTVQSWARSGIIPAGSGPGIDGCHRYRFDKARLLEWREERMSYQEASQWLGQSRATLHRWIHQGKLTPLPECQGKSRWFARSAVLQMAQEHTAP
jgi:predicted DNA-binding transcriptional regulator AlpA